MGARGPLARIALLLAVATGAMLASPPAAFGKGANLIASVGLNDASVISLTTTTGEPVTDLPSGLYLIEVHDYSSLHNFHLLGPGVDRSTDVGFVGTAVWPVFFGWKERYRYQSDPYSFQVRGTFTTDGGPPLIATVGPGRTISLRTDEGRAVTHMYAGRYWINVRDRSHRCNFHLRGPGVNRSTSVGFRGETTWILTLRPGRYRFGCDTQAVRMRGTFSVSPPSPG